jgi:hypothetical protein
MKNVNAFRKGVMGLAIAGLAGATFLTTSANAALWHDSHGDDITQTREVDEFTKIRIKGAFEVEVTAGKERSVTLKGDSRDLERVETYVRRGTLTIDNADDDDDHGIHIDSDGVRLVITVPMLEEFEVLGAVDAELRDIKSDNFVFELKGAGDVDIYGECGSLDLEIKGAGEVDAEDFKCKDVKVAVKGVGEAEVYASESVDADVSGIGSITVYGDPKKVRESDSWLGEIKIK